MLVIYHSVAALPARQAAALHTDLFDEKDLRHPQERKRILAMLGGTGLLTGKGLWFAGRDGSGRTVMALGRTYSPDIAHRAFGGIAELFGVEPGAYMLQPVGGGSKTWDALAGLMKRFGMGEMARTRLLRELDQDLPAAKSATAIASRRLAGWERLYP